MEHSSSSFSSNSRQEENDTSGFSWIQSVLYFSWKMLNYFNPMYLFSQADMDPLNAHSKFVRDFECIYGAVHPPFFQGSYQEACSASKANYKFLVVYLHAPMHLHTAEFCRETLCTDLISSFIEEHFLFWGCSVEMSDGFKVSNSLGASSYPFLAVVCNNSIGGVTILDRIEGLISPEALMMRLTSVLEAHGHVLTVARIDNEERERDRHLREEQDREFQKALSEDREKEHKRKEEEQRFHQEQMTKEREIQMKALKEEEIKRRRAALSASLSPEPPMGAGRTTQLVIRLPDGSRLMRRFSLDDRMQSVLDFVMSDPRMEMESFDLVSHFPRRVFSNPQMTLEEASLYPHSSLFIEERT